MAIAKPSGTRAFFAKRLRELRLPRGFKTARKFANQLGIDENRYTRYERAEVEPDLDLLVRICEVLDVTPNDLLGVYGEPAGAVSSYLQEFGDADEVTASDPNNRRPVRVNRDIGSVGRGSAAAWSLARHLVLALEARELSIHFGLDKHDGGTLGQLQLISALFQRIEEDPFQFVSTLSLSPLLKALSKDERERISKLLDAVVHRR